MAGIPPAEPPSLGLDASPKKKSRKGGMKRTKRREQAI
jgi:hypothetical protein